MIRNGSRSDWLHEAKWGVFMHFLAAQASSSQGGEIDAETWNRRVDSFDVNGLARQLQEAKARYFVLTLGQNSGHYCVPNETYDKLTGIRPSKCAHRDLVSELHYALTSHGIRLMVYLPSGAPCYEPVAIEKLGCTKGGRCAEFQRKWESVIREWSLRWGRKVSGWWFDGCYFIDEMYRHDEEPNFRSFAAAVRAGNPDSIVAWNPGVKYPPLTVDPEEDYTAGEVNDPQEVDAHGRWDKQAQFHILSYLGRTWGQPPVRFTAAEAIANTLSFTNCGGVVTWDVPHSCEGLINTDVLNILKEIGNAADATRGRPDMPPPKVVRPSITFLESPAIGDKGKSNGRARLSLKNNWNESISGRVMIILEPKACGKIDGEGHIDYDLQPGAKKNTELHFTVDGMAFSDSQARLILARSGSDRTLVYPLPVRERIRIPQIAALPSLDELDHSMKKMPGRTIINEQGQKIADIKIAATDMLL
jgi:hypothetical protein